MSQLQFEDLLNKHISVSEEITGYDFEESNINIDNFKNKHYSIKSSLDSNPFEIKNLYGIPYKYIFIQTDKKDITQSITIYLGKLINRKFYDAFNKIYGESNSILVIEKKTVISEGEISDENGFKQYARKSELDLREGTFQENPLYIIWEKDDYQIKALLKHKQNISEITFSKKEKSKD